MCNSSPEVERRQYVRINTMLDVRFWFTDTPSQVTFRATTRDISEGGMCLLIDEHKENIGEYFRSSPLKMQLMTRFSENEGSVVFPAAIVWTNCSTAWLSNPANASSPLLIGVRFDSLAEPIRARLRHFIAERLEQDQPW